MPTTLSLKELQGKFTQSLKQDRFDHSIPARSCSRVPVEMRNHIYARSYWARLPECLGEDFSRVKRAVGKRTFDKLAREYLEANPSVYASIAEIGKKFPQWLLESGLKPKWVCDLAELEWKTLVCREAYPTPAFDFAQLGNLTEGQLARLTLKLRSQVFLVKSSHAIHLKSRSPKKMASFIVVFLEQGRVTWLPIEKPMFDLLKTLEAPHSLQKLSSLAKKRKLPEQKISDWFHLFSKKGWLELAKPRANG